MKMQVFTRTLTTRRKRRREERLKISMKPTSSTMVEPRRKLPVRKQSRRKANSVVVTKRNFKELILLLTNPLLKTKRIPMTVCL
jgi:hypothetical protein